MSTTNLASVLGLTLVLMTSSAWADVAGSYDVKYEEVSTNCTSPLKYPAGKLDVKVKGNSVTVDISRTPLMQGSVAKGGKFSAKSKQGKTSLDGMDGVFSVAGKVTPEGMLALVMVGEYTTGGKALCSQSWNVVGIKADPSAKPEKPAPKKQSTDELSLLLPSILQ
ncbi:MAG: hypothetical protein JWP01_3123 [Myxococcales bacterium]|nr:hypothetical protein [Myxococcales bacterium]